VKELSKECIKECNVNVRVVLHWPK